jgi:hypothetical protein
MILLLAMKPPKFHGFVVVLFPGITRRPVGKGTFPFCRYVLQRCLLWLLVTHKTPGILVLSARVGQSPVEGIISAMLLGDHIQRYPVVHPPTVKILHEILGNIVGHC